MNIFIDSEFWEDGPHRPIELISLAMVADTGEELYVVNTDFDWGRCDSDWLQKNVRPSVGLENPLFMDYDHIDKVVLDWVRRLVPEGRPQFWGYYADYDWVVLCQVFGRMVDLPNIFPRYCMDIKQLANMAGDPQLPLQLPPEHNALADARWNKLAWEFVLGLVGQCACTPS